MDKVLDQVLQAVRKVVAADIAVAEDTVHKEKHRVAYRSTCLIERIQHYSEISKKLKLNIIKNIEY